MTATYFILQPDGTEAGPVPQTQILEYLQLGQLGRQSLVRRADLAEFFALGTYPEFAPTPVPVPRASAIQRPSGIRRPAPSSVTRQHHRMGPSETPIEGQGTMWTVLVLLVVALGWGAKVGWDNWQVSAAAKQQAAAEQWRSENLPTYEVASVESKLTEFASDTERELLISGEVQEKERRVHPEYGRAERQEVFVRLALRMDPLGEIPSVRFPVERVKIRDGKGSITVTKYIPMNVAATMLADPGRIKVDARIQYEK
jgi:hypothetical protein